MIYKIMTWAQIKKLYPNQMVGLTDVTMHENGSVIQSGIVKYTSKDTTQKQLSEMAMKGDIILRYTTLDEEELKGIL